MAIDPSCTPWWKLPHQRGLLELKDLPQAEAQARKVLTMELSETTGWDSQENDDLGIFW